MACGNISKAVDLDVEAVIVMNPIYTAEVGEMVGSQKFQYSKTTRFKSLNACLNKRHNVIMGVIRYF